MRWTPEEIEAWIVRQGDHPGAGAALELFIATELFEEFMGRSSPALRSMVAEKHAQLYAQIQGGAQNVKVGPSEMDARCVAISVADRLDAWMAARPEGRLSSKRRLGRARGMVEKAAGLDKGTIAGWARWAGKSNVKGVQSSIERHAERIDPFFDENAATPEEYVANAAGLLKHLLHVSYGVDGPP